MSKQKMKSIKHLQARFQHIFNAQLTTDEDRNQLRICIESTANGYNQVSHKDYDKLVNVLTDIELRNRDKANAVINELRTQMQTAAKDLDAVKNSLQFCKTCLGFENEQGAKMALNVATNALSCSQQFLMNTAKSHASQLAGQARTDQRGFEDFDGDVIPF